MKMNIGSVSSGYHFMSFIAAAKPRSKPPRSPQSRSAERTATKPMAAKTRWPVASMSIISANIRIVMSS